ncbi:MAG: hypothetical protein KY432_01245 [Acidobacteria bacterium]|nr:hypothetical protein [Acidobacteriota bacterium]
MMFGEQIAAALQKPIPTTDPAWTELEAMAESSPETAVELICMIAQRPLSPSQRGWLAVGPLRSAIASANPTEEVALEERTKNDPALAAMLDALLRYETKQRLAAELLEGSSTPDTVSSSAEEQIMIPNVHEQTTSTLDQEAWSKIVQAIHAAPENQLFMLTTTVIEPLLLRNETAFRESILERIRDDEIFRRALSYCDLSFSEGFLDEMIGISRQSSDVSPQK